MGCVFLFGYRFIVVLSLNCKCLTVRARQNDEMKMIEHTVESNVLRFRKRSFRTLATSRVDIPIFS